MRFIFGILASITGIYSLIIFIRIILSWFANTAKGKPVDILIMITDPYLDWWKRRLPLNVGNLDFSVIPAIVFLSFAQNIFRILSSAERITLGFLLAEILLAIWNIFSFITGFFIIVIIIRLIGYFINSNIYSPFWSVINSITSPVLYKTNRIFFGKKIGGYLTGIILSLLLLILILIGGGLIINLLSDLLYKLPI